MLAFQRVIARYDVISRVYETGPRLLTFTLYLLVFTMCTILPPHLDTEPETTQ